MDILIVAIFIALVVWMGFYFGDKWKGQEKISEKKQRINNGILKKEKETKTEITDYGDYIMTVKEFLMYLFLAGVTLYFISYIFYHNIYISFIIALLSIIYPRFKKRELILKRKYELLLQFKQALYSLSSALVAGKSIENAFKETVIDLKMLYPNPDVFIIQEFSVINRKVENGEPIEKAIADFSTRADSEDITSFSDVFITSKKTGGDMVEVIRKTSNIISEKIDIKQEIAVLIAQKKFEAKILSIAPFALVGLVSYSSPDYMEPMYQLGIGSLIMTISLVMLGISYWLSKWIMDIKV